MSSSAGDPRVAALAEALAYHDHQTSNEKWLRMRRDHLSSCLSDECAAAILAALPADWCGHDAKAMDHEACHAWHESDEAEIARLRRIEEELHIAVIRQEPPRNISEDAMLAVVRYRQSVLDLFRAALEEKPA